MKFKPSTLLLLYTGSLVLLFFFIVKCLHFYRCDYTSDIITHLQLSRDWLLGKPLMYENSFGLHSKFHNYFIDPLMAPFTWLFGGYGLLIVLFSLLLIAYYSVLKMLEIRGASFQTKLLFVIFYVGPLSYFTLHNEHYGFHTEMLLIPLCLLFISSFFQNNKWYWIWAILVLTIKEDAVVILWCCLLTVYLTKWHQKDLSTKLLLKKSTLSSLLCLLIFGLGMVWLKYLNNWGPTRSGVLFQTLKEQTGSNLASSFRYLIVQRVQLTVFVVLIIFLYTGWKFTLGVMLLSIPILILNLLSGVLYFLDGEFMVKNYFSLLWAPRLSMYWAYWLSVLVLSLNQKPNVIIYPKFLRSMACAIFGILVFKFQYYFFLNCYVTRFNIIENIEEVFGPNIEFELNPDFRAATAIARHLPANYPVAPMYRVFAAFHKQDIIWLNSLSVALTPPRMILASYNKQEIPDVTQVMRHPYFMLYQDKLHIYTEAEDTIYVSKAGIAGAWKEIKPLEK